MAVFCLAMVAKAKLAKAASGRNPREYNETTARFDFRVALLHASGATRSTPWNTATTSTARR